MKTSPVWTKAEALHPAGFVTALCVISSTSVAHLCSKIVRSCKVVLRGYLIFSQLLSKGKMTAKQ